MQFRELLDRFLSITDMKEKSSLKKELLEALQLDELNFSYFITLYKKFKSPAKHGAKLVIAEASRHLQEGDIEVFPTAIAPKEIMKELPAIHYDRLKSDGRTNAAKKACLWIKKMQAGTGTSMDRTQYLAKLNKVDASSIEMGAKGTDLFVQAPTGEQLSIAELQLLQAISDQKRNEYSSIILHDIVSRETEDGIDNIWNKKAYNLDGQTYAEYFAAQNPKLVHYGKTLQAKIPTIDDQTQVSFNRIAPGGHALFGVDALRAAYKDELRPHVKAGEVLISSIGNGEDLSSSPDALMVNWMVEKEIPIAMVTTTKTGLDLKGGQVGIVVPKSSSPYVALVEKAQAETAGQGKFFEELGLREGDREAFFNTNMVLINYNVLIPKIKKAVADIGEESFLQVIAPDLILNHKKQKDSDGKQRTYTQLEGAMGSVFLNLDHFWRKNFGAPLVHILNVGPEDRTRFFSPIKTAFDFFIQFFSDRFKLDWETYRLVNQRPECLPQVTLQDSFYSDVLNTLEAFAGCQMKELDNLKIQGKVKFNDISFAGKVEVEAEEGLVRDFAGEKELKDCKVRV